MLTVYIADDELIVREGLKKIIDWHSLDFEICGEAGDGQTALEGILELMPDLVLLDIRMPKLHGLELAAQARTAGFQGKIIILSGYSEFKYAQDAIKCNVDFYLTKPIDEEQLYDAVKSIRNTIHKERLHTQHLTHYKENAKYKIMQDLMQVPYDGDKSLAVSHTEFSLTELNLDADSYQILIVDMSLSTKDTFLNQVSRLLKVPTTIRSNFEHLNFHQMDVLLLKGNPALDFFKTFMHQSFDSEANFFIAAGRVAAGMNEIYFSYHDALSIKERRFFCDPSEHVMTFEELPVANELTYTLSTSASEQYAKSLYEALQTYNRTIFGDILNDLKSHLMVSSNSVDAIKTFLSGMYLHIKYAVEQDYASYNIEFPPNSELIEFFHNQIYLTDVLDYFTTQFERILKIIGNASSDSIIDDILNYMQINYKKNLKLETLASMFGYNSSYLGKMFSKRVGENFNAHLDQIRIAKAKELLLQDKLKVYEIAESVGYKNVDYFHKKFKKYVGNSPAEYRSQVIQE